MTNPLEPPSPGNKAKSATVALILAFLPSVLFLGLLASGSHGQLDGAAFGGAFVVSIICCFASSIMLFRRKTGLAIGVGLILLLLNLAISFLFGCGALLSNAKF